MPLDHGLSGYLEEAECVFYKSIMTESYNFQVETSSSTAKWYNTIVTSDFCDNLFMLKMRTFKLIPNSELGSQPSDL